MGETGARVRRGGRLLEEKEGNLHPPYVRSHPTFQPCLRLCYLCCIFTIYRNNKIAMVNVDDGSLYADAQLSAAWH